MFRLCQSLSTHFIDPMRMDPAEPVSLSLERRKACTLCTHAKRRCNKDLPACRRCVEKNESCRYPSTRPYARRRSHTSKAADSLGSRPAGGPRRPATASTSAPETFEAPEDAFEARDVRDERLPAFDFSSPVNRCGDNRGTASFWFLRAETWAIEPSRAEPPDAASSIRVADFKQFTRDIKSWLSQWVQENHCAFLHRQLYSGSGLPPCLQDAYAAVAVYATKNDKNEETVMQTIEENAHKLLNQQPLDPYSQVDGAQALGTAEQLARVQALFIYQFIRLFDGDIRQRALAERQISTLTEWNRKLWESANLGASLQTSLGLTGLFSQGSGVGYGNDVSARQWHDWLLAESVRRIWLLANYVQCVYITMRDGQASCAGGVTFTARRGLWDAPSAATWMDLLGSYDPLFASSYLTDDMISSVAASEVDGFCLSIMSIMVDTPKIDFWVSKSHNRLQGLLEK